MIAIFRYLIDMLLAWSLPDPAVQPQPEAAERSRTVVYTATTAPVVVTAKRLLNADMVDRAVNNWAGRLTLLQRRRLAHITAALNRWEVSDLRQIAYVIATAWHETDKLVDLTEDRARVGTALRRVQDRYWGTGYWGRGYIHTTWKENYEKLSELLQQDFVNNPELLLMDRHAADSLVVGMRDGIYTSRRLDHYFTDTLTDWRNARRIVNGLDKSWLIAGYAQGIYKRLLDEKED